MFEFLVESFLFPIPLFSSIVLLFALGVFHLTQDIRYSNWVLFLCVLFPPASWYFGSKNMSIFLFKRKDSLIHSVLALFTALFIYIMLGGLMGVGVYSRLAFWGALVCLYALPMILLIMKIRTSFVSWESS